MGNYFHRDTFVAIFSRNIDVRKRPKVLRDCRAVGPLNGKNRLEGDDNGAPIEIREIDSRYRVTII